MRAKSNTMIWDILRLQVLYHTSWIIQRPQHESKRFLVLNGIECSGELFRADLLVHEFAVLAVRVIVLMANQKLGEATEIGKTQKWPARCLRGFLTHDHVCGLLIMKDHESLAHDRHRAN